MKTYNLTFAHPVAGKAHVSELKQGISCVYSLKTDPDGVIKIPLNHITKGNWHITFEWEHEDHLYSCEAKIAL